MPYFWTHPIESGVVVNTFGQLGLECRTNRTDPTQISGLDKIHLIAAGGDPSSGIKLAIPAERILPKNLNIRTEMMNAVERFIK